MGNSADIEGGYFPDVAPGKGKGKGEHSAKPPPPPPRFEKGQGKAKIRRQWTIAEVEEKPREGTPVIVTVGPHQGRRGVVIKVMGEGSATRYRVSFGDGKATTWVDAVQRVAMRGAAPEDPETSEPSRGSWNDPEQKCWNTNNKVPLHKQASFNGSAKTHPSELCSQSINRSEAGDLNGARRSRVPTASSIASEATMVCRCVGKAGDAMDPQSTTTTEPKLPERGLPSQITLQSELQKRLPSAESSITRIHSGSSRQGWISIQTSRSTMGTTYSHETSADFKYQESINSRHGVPMPKNRNIKYKRLVTAQIKAKEGKLREKSEREKRELQQRKDHYKALKPADVTSVPWDQAVEINWVHGGSGGILLVDLGDQGIVLKPQGKTAVSEQLAQLMAPICGVRVAQCKIVKRGEKEHDEIIDIHVKKDVPVVGGDKLKASSIFGKWQSDDGEVAGPGAQYLGVLEYVPGHPLVGEEAHQVLTTPNPALLRDLGRLCAMDVLLNNMDRVPLPVWSNEGNLGNVMVAAHGGNIIGIDQQVNPIKAGPGFKLYMDKVENLFQSLAPGGDPSAVIVTLDKALQTNCGAPLTEGHAPHVLEGMRECLEAIASAWNDGSFAKVLEEAVTACHARFNNPAGHSHDHVVVFDQGELDRMKEFLNRVAEKLAAIVQASL